MIFLLIFTLVKEMGGGGHVNVWEHIVSLYYWTTKWILMKLWRDGILIASRMCLGYFAR